MTCCTVPARRASAGVADAHQTKDIASFRPPVDVAENESSFIITADVPGSTAEQIGIDLDRGVLTLTARVEPRPVDPARPLRREFGVGDWRRVFRVGDSVDASAVTADYTAGVLTIRLPKTQSARARKITVQQA